MQTIATAVRGLQQTIQQAPLAPPMMHQPPVQPSVVAPPLEDHQHNECSEPRHHTSPRLIVESSYYQRSIPSTDFGRTNLARKFDNMGRQLEVLKVRSSHPFDAEFNAKLPFSPQIMSEAIPLKFRMP